MSLSNYRPREAFDAKGIIVIVALVAATAAVLSVGEQNTMVAVPKDPQALAGLFEATYDAYDWLFGPTRYW